MATPQAQAVRRWIVTGAVTAVTVSGTIYGAGLKTDRELNNDRKRYQEASPEEIIAQLSLAREGLDQKRKEMERKIASFHEKKKAKALEEQKQMRLHLQQQQQQSR